MNISGIGREHRDCSQEQHAKCVPVALKKKSTNKLTVDNSRSRLKEVGKIYYEFKRQVTNYAIYSNCGLISVYSAKKKKVSTMLSRFTKGTVTYR